jgi:type IV secretory pathway component VirB8
MKGKDIAIIILSIIAFIELLVIIFLMPIKTIEDTKPVVNSQWQNITTN